MNNWKTILSSEESNELKNTFLDKYQTIIFDIDGVLLDVFTPNGNQVGAYETTPPFRLKDSHTVIDINGYIIRLQEGIRDFIELLDSADKNLGIVSRSAREDLTFSAQPSVILLKKFNIYKYFNYSVIIKPFIEKQFYVKPLGKTLFIDDDRQWVDKVDTMDKVDVLWRKGFQRWEDLLQKEY